MSGDQPHPGTSVLEQDLRIRNDIESELQWDPRIDDRKIGVVVHRGIVTLTGEVYSPGARKALEEIVRRTKGVQAIANEVSIHLRSIGERCDIDLAEAVNHALRSAVVTRWARIQPVVSGGIVSLRGAVRWKFQRRVAQRLAGEIPGVKRVIDLLTVRPAFHPAETTDGPLPDGGTSCDSHREPDSHDQPPGGQ